MSVAPFLYAEVRRMTLRDYLLCRRAQKQCSTPVRPKKKHKTGSRRKSVKSK